MAKGLGFRFEDIHGLLDSLFGEDVGELVNRRVGGRAGGRGLGNRSGRAVAGVHGVATAEKPLDHAQTHLAKTDHRDFRRRSSCEGPLSCRVSAFDASSKAAASSF